MSEADWKPYVVQQGDHLHKLAFRSGCEADAAWEHPSNADLRARRASMNLLCPGDVLHLPSAPGPGLEVRARSHNRYRVKMPTVRVALALQQPSGPMANEPFEVRGVNAAGEPLRGTSTAAGEVVFDVPIHVRQVEVHMLQSGLVLPVRVGDLDPITERSGVVQRLQELGELAHGVTPDDATLAQALRAYQRSRGLEVTGLLTAATRAALEKEHGA